MKIPIERSLAFRFPNVAKEWNYDINNDNPSDVFSCSAKHRHWKCIKCNHVWKTAINYQTSGRTGCPSCAGKILSDSNRLSIKYPNIAKEWNFELNNDTPDDVSIGSLKKDGGYVEIVKWDGWHLFVKELQKNQIVQFAKIKPRLKIGFQN
jgi:hypothetical protein